MWPVLQSDHIDAGYGPVQVLGSGSHAIPEGAIAFIVGPNGAGKSTILKVINGLVRPTAGHIVFQEKDITALPAHNRPALGIASCPEGRRLFPLLTAETNLRLGAYTARGRKAADATLEYVYRLFPRLQERAGGKARRPRRGQH